MKVTLSLPVGAVLNCADNSGAKSIYIFAAYGCRGRLNRLPSASIGDMVLVSIKKGKPTLRKKGKKNLHELSDFFICLKIFSKFCKNFDFGIEKGVKKIKLKYNPLKFG